MTYMTETEGSRVCCNRSRHYEQALSQLLGHVRARLANGYDGASKNAVSELRTAWQSFEYWERLIEAALKMEPLP